jgi:hypothetical protein
LNKLENGPSRETVLFSLSLALTVLEKKICIRKDILAHCVHLVRLLCTKFVGTYSSYTSAKKFVGVLVFETRFKEKLMLACTLTRGHGIRTEDQNSAVLKNL